MHSEFPELKQEILFGTNQLNHTACPGITRTKQQRTSPQLQKQESKRDDNSPENTNVTENVTVYIRDQAFQNSKAL